MVKINPKFFKVHVPEESSERMRIPHANAFVACFDEWMPEKVILRNCIKDFWLVEVGKIGNEVFFQNGWKTFVIENLVESKDLLVFEYSGNFIFDVALFGESGLEKGVTRPKKTSYKKEEEEDDVVLIDERMEDEEEEEEEEDDDDDDGDGDDDDDIVLIDIEEEEEDEEYDDHEAKSTQMKMKKKAESFTSKFPYFKICMTKSSTKISLLRIPCDFAREHLPQGKSKVVLRTSEGKSWEVMYVCNGSNRMLSSGWSAFAHENKLMLGDICIFELVAQDELQVHIFR